MKKQSKPAAVTVFTWLKDNGFNLGPLTNTDERCLMSAVQIAEVWIHNRSDQAAIAFGQIVDLMQPQTRRYAYHATAHVGDWDMRSQLWTQAGLCPLDDRGFCKFEPSRRHLLTETDLA